MSTLFSCLTYKTSETTLAPMTELALEKQQQVTPMQMIQRAFDAAIANNQGLEVVDRILQQMREQRDYEDRLAFQAALRRIQDELKPIAKRGDNPDTRSKFATAEDIDREIQHLLQKEEMTLSFVPRISDKPDEVLMVGILSLGAYSKEYPLPMPADGKGAKGGGVMSRTHATGSAITYGKRYLKNMIFDLRFKEHDDDGNQAGGAKATLTEGAHDEWIQHIAGSSTVAELQTRYLEALAVAEKIADAGSIRDFIAAKDKRVKELKR